MLKFPIKIKNVICFNRHKTINVVKEKFPQNQYPPRSVFLSIFLAFRCTSAFYPVGELLVCHESFGTRFRFSIASPYFFPCSIFLISILMAESNKNKHIKLSQLGFQNRRQVRKSYVKDLTSHIMKRGTLLWYL